MCLDFRCCKVNDVRSTTRWSWRPLYIFWSTTAQFFCGAQKGGFCETESLVFFICIVFCVSLSVFFCFFCLFSLRYCIIWSSSSYASNYLFTIFKKCLLHNKNVTFLKIITFACYLTRENMSPPSRDVRNIYSSRVYISKYSINISFKHYIVDLCENILHWERKENLISRPTSVKHSDNFTWKNAYLLYNVYHNNM